MSTSKPVLLLKDPPEDVATDTYATRLSASGYSPRWISPLTTVLTKPPALQELLEAGAQRRWRGVIVTSKRAVRAWETAVGTMQYSMKGKEKESRGWDEVPFFAVGPATAQALAHLPASPYSPLKGRILGAEESGTGSALSRFIISHFHDCLGDQPESPLPLLYLTGDKRSPALHEALSASSPPVPFTELEVYATQPSTSIDREFSELLDDLSRRNTPLRWIVLFSPSGGKAIIPELRRRRLLGADLGGREGLKIAAIGPTTETWMKEEIGFGPDAVAVKPEADALVKAMAGVDGDQ